jgi:maleylpyruvate isomerase
MAAHRERMATETWARAWESGLPPSARATRAAPAGAGYLPSPVPHDLLAGVSSAHRRLVGLTMALDDLTVARPSLLAGWTVGHVLTHLDLNAASHANVFEAAGTGAEPLAQYPAGPAEHAAAVEAGAARPASEIRDGLAASIARLERVWDATHIDVWRTGLGLWHLEPGTDCDDPVTLADLVFLRWREVEIHGVDLGLADRGGPGWADLPAPYVDSEWAWTTARLSRRLPLGGSVLLAPGDRPSRAFGVGPHPVIVRAPTAETLRWLLGRLPGPAAPGGWPALSPWE